MRRQYTTKRKVLTAQLSLAGLSVIVSMMVCPTGWANVGASEVVIQHQNESSPQEDVSQIKKTISLQHARSHSKRIGKRSESVSYRLIAGTSTDVIDKVTTEKEPTADSTLTTSVWETEKELNSNSADPSLSFQKQLPVNCLNDNATIQVETGDNRCSTNEVAAGTACDTVKAISSTMEAGNQGADNAQRDETISAEPKPATRLTVEPFCLDSSKDAFTSKDTEVKQNSSGQQMALLVAPNGSENANATSYEAEPIIIDNDEIMEQSENVKFEQLETDEGKTRIKTGAQFPVVVSSQITSKTARKGDPIQARLKYDLKIGNRLIAKKGSVVTGHINYCLRARSVLHSLVSPERWYRNSGCLGVSFDEIINEKGEHLPLIAVPARQARIVKNKGEGRELGVNHNGQVTGPWAQQLRYKALRIGLNAALAPAGVFSFGAMPVALGVIGAANPSFAFMKPVGLNVRHRRIKGFAWGFLSGIPGSWLIEDTVVKGQEAVIKPGDEFLAEFKQEFTGEPATEADLLPGTSAKVRGQIVDDGKPKKKKRSSSLTK